MNYFFQLSSLFFFGLIIESLLLLKSKIGKIELLIISFCIGLGLIAGFYSLKGDYSQSSLAGGLVISSVIFATTFAWIFTSKILITINELTLLVWNLLFVYLYFQRFHYLNAIAIVIILLSIATLANAFLKIKINAFWKALFYVWFLIILAYFAISQFNFKNLAFLDEHENIYEVGRLTALLSGMAFFYITVNVWYLYKLIPIPDRDQTLKARINEWKEDIHLIISKYSDEQFSYTKNLLILFIVVVVLLLNYGFQFVTNSLLISFCISIVPFVVLKKSTKEKSGSLQ